MMEKYFGKFRGKVIDNRDLQRCGRLKVIVPSLLNNVEIWAMPCVPYAGPNVGLLLLPPVGANVWVEFEEGILDFPIWSGCYWREGDLPAEAKDANNTLPEVKLLKTEGITLLWNERAGITMKVVSPAVPLPLSLTMTNEGIILSVNDNQVLIKIDNGNGISLINAQQSIKISHDNVSINDGNLEIT